MIEIGMDQHKHFSYAVALNPASGATTEARLEHDEPDLIRSFVRAAGPQVRVSLETTGNWAWLCDLLQDEGAQVQLCDTVQTRRLLKAQAKTDRLDAAHLATMSARGILPRVYVPPRQVRDGRERHRYRLYLVWTQSRLKNRIHALLAKLNLRFSGSDLFGKRGRAFLDQLSLKEPHETQLRSALRLLDAVQAEVALMRREIAQTLKADPRAELIQTVPGVGELTAYLLLYEIGPIERFPTDRHFASYCSLAPATWQSAERRRDGHIGRRGNLYLKGALTEAVQSAVRSDPGLRAFYLKLRARKGTGKALIAVARKLAVAIYHVMKRGEPYRPARSKTQRAGKPVLCNGQARKADT